MNKEEYSETLSKASFWTVVAGSILIGLRGLGGFAGKQLEPLAMIPAEYSTLQHGLYLLVGVAGLHQAYFGYSSFKKLLEFENPWED